VTIWWLIIGCAVVTAIIKAAGPVALGGRELPPRFNGVIALMASALLAALVVTSALAEEDRWHVGPDTAGVAVAGLLMWRGLPMIGGVFLAALITALLRAV
jgi:branched-subunit amino acid transport protein